MPYVLFYTKRNQTSLGEMVDSRSGARKKLQSQVKYLVPVIKKSSKSDGNKSKNMRSSLKGLLPAK